MLIPELEGLKFPVEYLIKFFFKEGLHQRTGRVLELGCGNGNNLMLFYQYGWDVMGVDCALEPIEQARRNFGRVATNYGLANSHQLCHSDMVDFVELYDGLPFEVVLLPHSLYYLKRNRIERLFQLLVERQVFSPDAMLFLTVRTLEDYRFGRGERVGDNSYQLLIAETGEEGCIVTFFAEWEIVDLLRKYFNVDCLKVSRQLCGNYQNDQLVTNSDVTIWGRIN
jgi:SAM-dependent methyltransferase